MNTCLSRKPNIFLFTSETKPVVSEQQWDRAAAPLFATSLCARNGAGAGPAPAGCGALGAT